MNYSVILVQQGISAQSHPVNGKSGKLYGTAVASPEHGGVIFQMTMHDYLENAHDVVGNLQPSQQWVPEFVPLAPKAGHQKCDRCSKHAVARWDRYFYCEEHAPDNAVYLDGSGSVKKAPTGAGREAPLTPDVAPVVEERLSGPVEEERELPTEHMAAPAIGGENEDRPPVQTEAGTFVPEKKAAAEPTKPGLTPPPEPKAVELPTDKAQNVIIAITEGVLKAVMPRLDDIVSVKIAAATKALEHRGKKKPERKPRPETEFTKLQKQAKELGINSFGKNKEELRSEIAAKQEPPAS
jgi:hypothetical protein